MRLFATSTWIVGLSATASLAFAQANPPVKFLSNPFNYPRNADGSISENAQLPNSAKNYAGDCTNKFSINPNPVNVEQDGTATVTFNVGELGGIHVADTGSLVPASALENVAFNIHSGGLIEWWEGGPQVPFDSGTKPGIPYSRLTSQIQNGQSQTKTSPPYPTGGCYVLSAVVQGDFKRNANASGYDGSYRCKIEQAVVVQVSIPFTTLTCSNISPSAFLVKSNLVAQFAYTTTGVEDMHDIVRKVYGKHTSASDIAKLYKVTRKANADVVDPYNVPKGKVLKIADPSEPANLK